MYLNIVGYSLKWSTSYIIDSWHMCLFNVSLADASLADVLSGYGLAIRHVGWFPPRVHVANIKTPLACPLETSTLLACAFWLYRVTSPLCYQAFHQLAYVCSISLCCMVIAVLKLDAVASFSHKKHSDYSISMCLRQGALLCYSVQFLFIYLF
jgi:hypothetical protein